MARFFTLSFLAAGTLGGAACFFTSLRADPPAAPMQAQATGAAPASATMTNAAPVVPPPLPPDTIGRYGRIFTPSDEMAHPLKLNMPFPGVGEVKIPSQDELAMREKLEQLATMSDADIRAQLEQWPAYSKMNLKDQGTMLQRIQDFRDHHTKVAQGKAHQLGLLTLTPEQMVRFEKEYWDKQLQVDHELAKQFEPIMKARELKLQQELFREFSSATTGPAVPPPSPPSTNKPAPAPPPIAQAKPVQVPPPIAQAKPPPPSSVVPPAYGTPAPAPMSQAVGQ